MQFTQGNQQSIFRARREGHQLPPLQPRTRRKELATDIPESKTAITLSFGIRRLTFRTLRSGSRPTLTDLHVMDVTPHFFDQCSLGLRRRESPMARLLTKPDADAIWYWKIMYDNEKVQSRHGGSVMITK